VLSPRKHLLKAPSSARFTRGIAAGDGGWSVRAKATARMETRPTAAD